jgi:hypothetical protein
MNHFWSQIWHKISVGHIVDMHKNSRAYVRQKNTIQNKSD